jgi:hypothetical protein
MMAATRAVRVAWLIRMQTEIFERRARSLMMAKGA